MISEESSGQSTSNSEAVTATRETPISEVHEFPGRLLAAESPREGDVHIRDGLSPEQIDQRVSEKLESAEVQRVLVQELSPFSDRINHHIRTLPELKVYQSQDLQENIVYGRSCLTTEVDLKQSDAMGTSNAERMASGRAPVDENGDGLHLHHIGQKEASPLAELKATVHREWDSVLHDKSISTEVHGEGNNWNSERSAYWAKRSSTNLN